MLAAISLLALATMALPSCGTVFDFNLINTRPSWQAERALSQAEWHSAVEPAEMSILMRSPP